MVACNSAAQLFARACAQLSIATLITILTRGAAKIAARPGFRQRQGEKVEEKPKTGGAEPVRAGQRGEQAVRNKYDIGDKEVITVNGRDRIPDGVTDDVLSEVKNVKELSYTRQLRDFNDFAQQTGRRFDLYTRPDTKLSQPILDLAGDEIIDLKFIPGL